jgi:2-polyprenyl-3-methyl-5-hydroxy-6-metoxy-1,4-benzoquinol methylase
MEPKEHWEKVYGTKSATEVSWFQEHAELSLRLIQDAGTPGTASIIDVGGGASVLVDDLLSHDYVDVTVLDLSGAAIASAKSRLGKSARLVKWIEASILDVQLPEATYDVWHDRAVFHFLTNDEDRHTYVEQVMHAVRPGGLVIVATFAEDGPTECSGLPVIRYNAEQLHSEFGEPFILLGHEKESHHTPGGKEQKFVYCFCRKTINQ